MIQEVARTELEDQVFKSIEDNYQLPLGKFLDQIAVALHDNFPHYTGVYVYLLEGDTLVLGPYRGRPTEHTRIPIGAGICGRAARVKQTVVVDDVTADAEYIACSLATRSEIVVPIMREDRVLGEIDVDSDVPSAFSVSDGMFLEAVAKRIEPKFDHETTKRQPKQQ